MHSIRSLSRIVSQDPAVHLNCRVHQTLALIAAKTPAAELLYYRALYDSHRVFEHCYLKKELRWSYPYPYTDEDDMRNLGFVAERRERVSADEFLELVSEGVDRDEPVSFFAPRAEFEYQADYLDRMGLPRSGFLPHSFLACGVNDPVTALLIRDDATDNHEFTDFVVPWRTVRAGWEADPEQWFTDILVLRETGDDASGPGHFSDAYTKNILGLGDEFEIYDFLHDRLAEEREAHEVFGAPGLNCLSMLAGARIQFCRFLRHTRHSDRLRETYRRNMKALCALLDEATLNHVERSPAVDARIRRGLSALKRRESSALGQLMREVDMFQGAGVEAVRFPGPATH
ncbi:hypothetical protein [Streptomyces sp. NBC_00078]|uniref:hypothetical protein n=1 Tax=unclassified Streptomyces TaxID=2593676 RepID=UPI00224D21B3|nr:hypothetical protein [Streptomyces sp. NBC_00078]MCX5418136.1 hypothetical protein [Streptomyces sp. NBC_00078]